MTALLSLRPLSAGELRRVLRALAAEGLAEMRVTRIVLTLQDAQAVSEGDDSPITVTIVPDKPLPPTWARTPEAALTEALAAARARGAAVKEDLLADPEMLNTAGMAELLGMSEEGVRLKRKRQHALSHVGGSAKSLTFLPS